MPNYFSEEKICKKNKCVKKTYRNRFFLHTEYKREQNLPVKNYYKITVKKPIKNFNYYFQKNIYIHDTSLTVCLSSFIKLRCFIKAYV